MESEGDMLQMQRVSKAVSAGKQGMTDEALLQDETVSLACASNLIPNQFPHQISFVGILHHNELWSKEVFHWMTQDDEAKTLGEAYSTHMPGLQCVQGNETGLTVWVPQVSTAKDRRLTA